MELFTLGLGAIHLWLLFMLRTLGFVAIVPLFSARAAPAPFRIVLTFFISLGTVLFVVPSAARSRFVLILVYACAPVSVLAAPSLSSTGCSLAQAFQVSRCASVIVRHSFEY